jgi:UDP-N-acetylmuramate dehydrogenase
MPLLRSVDAVMPVLEHVPLAPLTSLGVGGPARWFVRAGSVPEIMAADRFRRSRNLPVFVLGGGSNVVVADRGFEGLVLQVNLKGVAWRRVAGDTIVTAGAGEAWDDIVAGAVERGLAGVECLSGIPGTVGGTPIQNVGAYGQEVADTIECVTVYELSESRTRLLSARDCGFSYRTSRFKAGDAGGLIVCKVRFRLRPGRPTLTYPELAARLGQDGATSPSLENTREAVLAVRRLKGMVIDPADPETRSVGSFFLNPVITEDHRERIAAAAGTPPPGFPAPGGRVKVPAAWLIERAGFTRGQADGPVAISTRHTLALVNRGGATARDVLRMAATIKRRVGDRFDVWLRPEPTFVGLAGDGDLEMLMKANP